MCIPLLLGILFQFNFELNLDALPVILILCACTIFTFIPLLNKTRISKIIHVTTFFFIGIYAVNSKNSFLNPTYFAKSNYQIYQVRILEPPTEKQKSIKIKVDVLSRNDTVTIGKSLIYLEKTEASKILKYGDILLIHAKFNPITPNGNPLEFDYGKYLKQFDIHHQTYLKQNKWQHISQSTNSIFEYTYAISNYLNTVIEKSDLKPWNKPIAKALLLGHKEDLDKETLRTYSSAGAMHVLAVSGLHVGIIMLILMYILKPIKKIIYGRHIFVILILFGVWFYAFITGLSPSVLRSSLMFSFIIIGKELQRETSIYQSILVSAFILLLIDPLSLFKVGFQLSYLAVLGIIYLQPKIYNLLYTKHKVIDKAWQITSVSIAAQIATFPLGLFYFHQFPNLFLISNLIVIPLAGLILGAGFSFFVFHKTPYISDTILCFLDWFLSFMNWSVNGVKELPYSITWGISISWFETFIIYIILLLLTFAFSLRKTKLFLYSGLTTIFLLSLFILKNETIKQQNELVIYNIKDEITVDLFFGKSNILLSSNSLANNQDKLLFNIQHYWYYKNGQEKPSKHIDFSDFKTPIIDLNKKSLSIISKNICSKYYKTDFVLIGEINYINKDCLLEWQRNKTVLVLHQKCNYYTRNYIKQNYPHQLLHDLKQDGAFTFSF
jgi:competence protein ComEC